MLSLTDRSRYLLGLGRCARARWEQYHSGPTGYGMVRRATSMPLATGTFVHQPIADVLELQRTQGEVSRVQVRGIVEKAVTRYRAAVASRGFDAVAGELGGEEQERAISEQCCLVEGFVWGFYRVVLPSIKERYHILQVEQEGEIVMGCTCGLGEAGAAEDHNARDCNGTLWQTRPDVILQDKINYACINLDHKTGATVRYKSWQDQWDDSVQLVLNCLGSEVSVGKEIEWSFVFGMHKGPRKERKEDGQRWQDSLLCYAWRKPANPPNWGEEWAPSWEYVDDEGKNRTLRGKGFERAPVWTANFSGKPADWRVIEYWVEWLPEETLREQFVLLGPLTKPQYLIASLLETIPAEEARWRERNWKIYEALAAAEGRRDDLEVQRVLNQEAPQSWECRRYNSLCQFYPICKKQEGWSQPLESGKFELRRPHHERELQEMIARGIEPPPEQWEEEGED